MALVQCLARGLLIISLILAHGSIFVIDVTLLLTLPELYGVLLPSLRDYSIFNLHSNIHQEAEYHIYCELFGYTNDISFPNQVEEIDLLHL